MTTTEILTTIVDLDGKVTANDFPASDTPQRLRTAGEIDEFPHAPGSYLRGWMDENGRTDEEVESFFIAFGCSSALDGVLDGTVPLNTDVAVALEALTGTPAKTWLKREYVHQLEVLQLEQDDSGCGHGWTTSDHRDGNRYLCEDYTPEAAAKADQLFLDAPGYHSGPYTLADQAPVPGWLKEDLAGVQLNGLEAGWPQFARTQAPINWVARLKACDPSEARWIPAYKGGTVATGEVLDELGQLAAAHGSAVRLDVFLYTEPDGAVGVHPCALWLEPSKPDLDARVEQILNKLNPPTSRDGQWYRHDGIWEL